MAEKISKVIEVESGEDEVSRAETLQVGCVSGSKGPACSLETLTPYFR